jgi:hypothetical protein
VLLGGAGMQTGYIETLRILKKSKLVLPLIWVGQNFEFGGSTISLSSPIEDADFYLFHHYSQFFQVRDPLLVKIHVRDAFSSYHKNVILEPDETLRINLNEVFPQRRGPSVVEFSTTHPVLTRRRHRRWRVWADLYWQESMASLHGAHDYGPSIDTSTVTSPEILENGRVIITIPNYYLDMKPLDQEFTVLNGDETSTARRDPLKPVEEFEFTTGRYGPKHPYIGMRFNGYGDNFWTLFETKGFNGAQHPVLMSNHKGTQPLEIREASFEDGDSFAWVQKILDSGFLIYPHALPVLDETNDLEFGFSFDWANPQVKHFNIYCFNPSGELVGNFKFEKKAKGHIFTSQILENQDKSLRSPGLLIIEPDFSSQKIDPKKIYMWGDLTIRNKKTQDRDITEFQNCWRNVGVQIEKFPHWLHPSKSVVGRTNLVGRVTIEGGKRTYLILVNGSGNKAYRTKARCTITLFDHEGKSSTIKVDIHSFGYRNIALEDLFPGLNTLLSKGYGSLTIYSPDADLNAQIYTTSPAGSVGLQHLWGY